MTAQLIPQTADTNIEDGLDRLRFLTACIAFCATAPKPHEVDQRFAAGDQGVRPRRGARHRRALALHRSALGFSILGKGSAAMP